jgi:hypothetical protein
MAVRLRPISKAEWRLLTSIIERGGSWKGERWVAERAEVVIRARILALADEGGEVAVIAAQAGALRGVLRGVRRPGRSRALVYGPDVVRRIGDSALTHPADLALPYARWTLERLQRHLNEREGSAIRHSRASPISCRRRGSGSASALLTLLRSPGTLGGMWRSHYPWSVTPSVPSGDPRPAAGGDERFPAPDA